MKTLEEISRLIDGELSGPGDLKIKGIQSLDAAGPDEISFAVSERYAHQVANSRAGAFILPTGWKHSLPRPAVFVKDPYLAYALVAAAFSERPFRATGISQEAHIGLGCRINRNVSIYPGVFLGKDVEIGESVTLYPGVVLGDGVTVGEGSTIFPNVVIYEGCKIGRRVRIHANAVIGSDGFGYARDGMRHVKIPQTGIVVVEDDVEIGAGTTIDRAALGRTTIGAGTKIDNLVQIGHNVVVGPGSIIVAQAGISGSTRLGKGVVLGGQVGLTGHIELGDGVKVAAQSGVARNISPGEVVSGSPAMPHRLWLRVVNSLKRIPELIKDVRSLKERVKRIEDGR